jgi:hypothetical protein
MLVFDVDYLTEHDYGYGDEIDSVPLGRFGVGPGPRKLRDIFKERPLWRGFQLTFSPDGRWIAYRDGDYLVTRPATRRAPARRVRVEPVGVFSLSLSPGGRRIAFSRSFAELLDGSVRWIFAQGGDDSRLRRLTPGGSPAWSSTGWIAFTRHGRESPLAPEPAGVWLTRANGTGLRQLAELGDAQPTALGWSPDGQRIVFTGGGGTFPRGSGLTIINVASGRRRDIPQTRHAESVAWSPDGRRIAFELAGDVYTIRSDGGGRRKLVETERLVPSVEREPGGRVDIRALEWPRIDR